MPRSDLACYRLTPAAQRDLEKIWLYGADRWSTDQAERYADTMEETFERLRVMPELARERLEFDPPVRIHPVARHIVIYRIDGDHLTVLRILGQSQDWQSILKSIN